MEEAKEKTEYTNKEMIDIFLNALIREASTAKSDSRWAEPLAAFFQLLQTLALLSIVLTLLYRLPYFVQFLKTCTT